MTDFMDILRREVAASSIQTVADKIGYKRPSVSLLLNGKYPGTTDRIGAKIISVFEKSVPCRYHGQDITIEQCKAAHDRPMPMNSARELRHWTACQRCPYNPKDNPNKSMTKGAHRD